MLSGLHYLESNVKMPLMDLHVRSVVVELSSNIILISPGSKLTIQQLKTLTNVTDIVAPNLFHTAGISQAAGVFPGAKIWGPDSASSVKNEIKWTDELNDHKWSFQDELVLISIAGMPKVKESVYYHKKSKSLIVCDLCFNLINTSGFGAWMILGLFGTYKKFGVSRLFLRAVVDREAFTNSLINLFQYDFDNIIVSHGENVIGGAKEKLKIALRERGYFL